MPRRPATPNRADAMCAPVRLLVRIPLPVCSHSRMRSENVSRCLRTFSVCASIEARTFGGRSNVRPPPEVFNDMPRSERTCLKRSRSARPRGRGRRCDRRSSPSAAEATRADAVAAPAFAAVMLERPTLAVAREECQGKFGP